MASAHRPGPDKRVFILVIAAVLSALPLHIPVVFSDKARGQKRCCAGSAAVQCRGGVGERVRSKKKKKRKDWPRSERRDGELLTTGLLLCASVGLLLMLLGQFSSFKPALEIRSSIWADTANDCYEVQLRRNRCVFPQLSLYGCC